MIDVNGKVVGSDRIVLGLAAFGDLGFDGAVKAARALDFEQLDVQIDSIGAIGADPRFDSAGGRSELRSFLTDHGMRVRCVSNVRDCQLMLGPHGPASDAIFVGSVDEKRAHAYHHALRAMDAAVEFGAEYVRLFLGCPDYSRWFHWPKSQEDWQLNVVALAEALMPLLDEAGDRGLQLTLETHPKQAVFSLRTVHQLWDELGDRAVELGLCFDAANVRAAGHDPLEFIVSSRYLPTLVHIKDVEVDPSGLQAPVNGWATFGPQPCARFRALGWGELNWRQLASELASRGYDGLFVLEHEDVLIDRQIGLARAKERMDEIVSLSIPRQRWW